MHAEMPPNRLRELSRARRLRRIDIAIACGVYPSTVGRWEDGVIPWKHVSTVAALLGVTVPELFGWTAKDDGNDDSKTEAA